MAADRSRGVGDDQVAARHTAAALLPVELDGDLVLHQPSLRDRALPSNTHVEACAAMPDQPSWAVLSSKPNRAAAAAVYSAPNPDRSAPTPAASIVRRGMPAVRGRASPSTRLVSSAAPVPQHRRPAASRPPIRLVYHLIGADRRLSGEAIRRLGDGMSPASGCHYASSSLASAYTARDGLRPPSCRAIQTRVATSSEWVAPVSMPSPCNAT